MLALSEQPCVGNCSNPRNSLPARSVDDLDELVDAMGKRLQEEYIAGAIPYLREHEPELWAHLNALDMDQSVEALLAYEQLFLEGLHRYISHLEGKRRAA